MNPKRLTSVLLLAVATASLCLAQADALKSRLLRLISAQRASVCIAIRGPGPADTLFINGDRHCPMQSVYKFHLALAVLDRVEKGLLSLEQEVHIAEADLLPHTWSPIRERFPDAEVDLPLREVLDYTVTQSDNNGCDILFRLLGGPAVVDSFIRRAGFTEISIAATEEEMHRSWDLQYRNWTTPRAAAGLLTSFQNGEILGQPGRDLLWSFMVKTTTGAKRLRGLLPKGTSVAHKTGSSGSNNAGLTPATNDIGIILLPDGRTIAIAVFVSESRETEETNERVIARIAKEAWDYFRGGTRQTVPRIPGLVRP